MPEILKQVNEIIKTAEERGSKRKHKKRLYDIIEEDIRIKLKLAIKNKEIKEILKDLYKTIKRELEYVRENVSECFDKKYEILEFYIASINMFLREYIDNLIEDKENLEYDDILAIIYG